MQNKQVKDHYRCIFGPGYVVVSEEPALLCSVCGVGVIVTIWDRVRRSGGMIHCVYAKCPKKQTPTNYYADIALKNVLAKLRASRNYYHLEAQIFGGGDQGGVEAKKAQKVIAEVKKILKKRKIRVISEDVRGVAGRKIMFDTASGDVAVLKTKKVRKTDWAPEYLIEMKHNKKR